MAHTPRVPGRKKWKIYFKVIFPSLVALLVAFLVVVGYISYLIIFPEVSLEENPAYYSLLQYKEISVPYSGGSAWFLAGQADAPAVFLCHDYGFNRLSTLNLANLLHEEGYNLFVVSFRGHAGKSSVPTSLGLLEGSDLAATIDQALASEAVDQTRVGVWGVGLGAHAALRAALADHRIRVLVLDSPYGSVYDFLDYQVTKRIGFKSKIFGGSVGLVSAVVSMKTPFSLYEELRPEDLEGRSVLYVAGKDSPTFLQWTQALHDATPGDKQLLLLPRSRRSFLETPEWGGYDKQVTTFVTDHLPLAVERVPQKGNSAAGPARRRSIASKR
ncbi:MAG: alpha/beta hydrolase [Acidobacteriota bacterium]